MSGFDELDRQLLRGVVRAANPDGEPAPVVAVARGARQPGHWRLALSGGALVALVGVALLAIFSPFRSGSGPLSAQDAVAAAASDLRSDGILEWAQLGTYRRGSKQQGVPTRQTLWFDLHRGVSRLRQTTGYIDARGKRVVTTSTVWTDKTSTWVINPDHRDSTGKIVVRRTIWPASDQAQAAGETPLTDIQKTLDRAAHGKATIAPIARFDGVPAVKVIERGPRYVTTTWISRERSPRVLRIENDATCPNNTACDDNPHDGKPSAHEIVGTQTLKWRILPRTNTTIADATVPHFPPSQYRVLTNRFDNLNP